MTPGGSFTVQTIHPRVGRYLKRQEARVQEAFWAALDHLSAGPLPPHDPAHIAHLKGPLHCSYRYVLAGGRRGLRILYEVDQAAREITVYDFGPRGDVYRG